MKKRFGLLILLLAQQLTFAQKSMTLDECESEFLKNNLFLIAEQYNIEASKALTVQARIWENPLLTAELNAYNPSADKYFDIGRSGQKEFGIEQIIYLGGKKRNEVKLAKSNESLALLQFDDVLRNLKYELRKNFFTLYYNVEKTEATEKQLFNIQDLIASYSVQVQKGNIPLRDFVRLQSLLLNFKNEQIQIADDVIDAQATIKLLTNQQEDIVPIFNENNFSRYLATLPLSLETLQYQALSSRPDYLFTQKEIELSNNQIKYQKSLSIPDLTIGANYKQRSGVFEKESNLTLGIPLPLWNSNKGNIQQAKVMLAQANSNQEQYKLQLNTEVQAAHKKWETSRDYYIELYPTLNADFETVYNGILNNFKKRNISLLEFTDFMESYHQATIQLSELKKNVVLMAEELNTTVNQDLFK